MSTFIKVIEKPTKEFTSCYSRHQQKYPLFSTSFDCRKFMTSCLRLVESSKLFTHSTSHLIRSIGLTIVSWLSKRSNEIIAIKGDIERKKFITWRT